MNVNGSSVSSSAKKLTRGVGGGKFCEFLLMKFPIVGNV